MEKKIYFKVYQDKECIGDGYAYYIDTIENIMVSIPEWTKSTIEWDCQMPVLEPIEMSEDEFLKLPEFMGY